MYMLTLSFGNDFINTAKIKIDGVDQAQAEFLTNCLGTALVKCFQHVDMNLINGEILSTWNSHKDRSK